MDNLELSKKYFTENEGNNVNVINNSINNTQDSCISDNTSGLLQDSSLVADQANNEAQSVKDLVEKFEQEGKKQISYKVNINKLKKLTFVDTEKKDEFTRLDTIPIPITIPAPLDEVDLIAHSDKLHESDDVTISQDISKTTNHVADRKKNKMMLDQRRALLKYRFLSFIDDEEYSQNDSPTMYWVKKLDLKVRRFEADDEHSNARAFVLGCGENMRIYFHMNNDGKIQIKCSDKTGLRFIDAKEQEMLLYELKKIYLKNQEEKIINILNYGNENDKEKEIFSKICMTSNDEVAIVLKGKIKIIDDVIKAIEDDKQINYGHSFGQQLSALIKAIHIFEEVLRNEDENSQKCEIINLKSNVMKLVESFKSREKIFKQINKSLKENHDIDFQINLLKEEISDEECAQLDLALRKFKEDKHDNHLNRILTDLNSFNQEKINIFNLIAFQIENGIGKIGYENVSNKSIEKLIGCLIRLVKTRCLEIRKSQIDKELNKTKNIETAIREKKKEIRDIKEEFSSEFEITKDEEERFKRMINKQKEKTDSTYKEGFSRTKEESDIKLKKNLIRWRQFDDIAQEEKDIEDLLKLINNEYAKLNEQPIYKYRKMERLKNSQSCYVKEEHKVLDRIEKELRARLSELRKDVETLGKESVNLGKSKNKMQGENATKRSEILRLYEKHSRLLEDIKTKTEEIKETQNAIEDTKKDKINKVKEKEEKFVTMIFQQVGGFVNSNMANTSDDDVNNHKNCGLTTKGERGCHYKAAVRDGVQHALDKKRNGTDVKDQDVLNHLKSIEYDHSVPEHGKDLKGIAYFVSSGYDNLQEDIRKIEEECDRKIEALSIEEENLKNVKAQKERERDETRNSIRNLEEDYNKKCCDEKTKIEEEKVHEKFVSSKDALVELTEKKVTKAEEKVSNKREDISNMQSKEDDAENTLMDKFDTMNDIRDNIFGDNGFNEKLAVFKARLRYSEIEEMITSIGKIESIHDEKQRILLKIEELKKQIDELELVKSNYKEDKELKQAQKETCLSNVEGFNRVKQNYIEERAQLEESISGIGLENYIDSNYKELESLRLRKDDEIGNVDKEKAGNRERAKLAFIRHDVYGKISHKGVKLGDEVEEIDGDKMYKKRPYVACQDQKVTCNYFGLIDEIMKEMVNDKKDGVEIWNEKKESYTHIEENHKSDILKVIKVITSEIKNYDTKTDEIKKKYETEENVLVDKIKNAQVILKKRKRLDRFITIAKSSYSDKRATEERLKSGVDIFLNEEENEISFIEKSNSVMKTVNIDEYLEDKDQGFKNAFKNMINVSSERNLDLENVLLRKEDDDEKGVFKYIVDLFDKDYLKKVMEIENGLREIETVDNEVLVINRDVEKTVGYIERLKSRIDDLQKTELDLEFEEARHLSIIDEIQGIEKDVCDFEEMKRKYEELLNEWKGETENVKKLIEQKRLQIKNLKKKNKEEKIDSSLKSNILIAPFALGLSVLNDSTGSTYNRNCNSKNKCRYKEIAEVLIEAIINEINVKRIRLGSKLRNDDVDRILKNLNDQHCIQKHQHDLEIVIEYTLQVLLKHNNYKKYKCEKSIKAIEYEIITLTNEKDIKNEIYKDIVIQRISKINDFIQYKKEISVHDDKKVSSEDDDILSKEMKEHKNEQLTRSYKLQMEYLIRVFKNILNSGVTGIYFKRLEECTLNVFKDFYKNIEKSNLANLIKKLKADSETTSGGSKLKELFDKKRLNKGGIEYILKKISWHYQMTSSYFKNIDPENIYNQLLEKDRTDKEKNKEARIQELRAQLSELETQRHDLATKDYSLFIFEIECIERNLKILNDIDGIAKLKKRCMPDSNKKGRDDYYAFEFCNSSVCVRLLQSEWAAKAAEIKEIDKVRNDAKELEQFLLNKKAEKGSYEDELNETNGNQDEKLFNSIQRDLFKMGICIVGFERFENGEILDEINSFIAIILSNLLNQCRLYQIGGINETNKRIETFTKKIRVLCDAAKDIFEEPKFSDQDCIYKKQLKFILEIINDEFKSDNLSIQKVYLKELDKITDQIFQTNQNGIMITMFKYSKKYLSLISKSDLKLYKDDDKIDVSFKLANINAVLKEESDLFKELCEKRFQEVLKIDLRNSKTLGNDYHKEKNNLNAIRTLTEFNGIFCNILEPCDSILFSYLVHLEDLEEQRNYTEKEKMDTFKVIKDMYSKMLIRIIKLEQKRREKLNSVKQQASKEEIYLKKLIDEAQQGQDELLEQIAKKEEEIETDVQLIEELLLEKEKTMGNFNEKLNDLDKVRNDLKEKLKMAKDNLALLNQNKQNNERLIQDQENKIKKLEIDLKAIENRIKESEDEKEKLEQEIANLKARNNELQSDLKLKEHEKKMREAEKAKKDEEIKAGNAMVKFIKNLQMLFADSQFLDKRENLKKLICTSVTLKNLFGAFKKEKIVWNLLVKSIDNSELSALEKCVDEDVRIAGEAESEIMKRIQAVTINSVNISTEISNEVGKDGKIIRRFKVLATNVSYKDLVEKVKVKVTEEMQSKGSGLYFDNFGILSCTENGLSNIDDLPENLKKLVKDKIELSFQNSCYDEDPRMKSTFSELSRIINESKIDFKEVVKAYVDEIEVVAGGRFILDESYSYPGVDLTINAVDMTCVGDNVKLDTSGLDGGSFRFKKALPGSYLRRNQKKPNGDRGIDGYDGRDGAHGGNIVIKVENKIENLNLLKIVKANGGKGGEGQLGGDGDEGKKGKNGKPGKAPDTNGWGGRQTTVGFGEPGEHGGRGGAPGKSGRPGRAGKAGIISIQHGNDSLSKETCNAEWSSQDGLDGEDSLSKATTDRPIGGEGGAPGDYGMDEVREKSSFFEKSKTKHSKIDRHHMAENNPKFKEDIKKGKAVANTNSSFLWGLLGGGVVGGLLAGGLGGSGLEYRVVEDEDDRKINNDNQERGAKNNEDSRHRDDQRAQQDEKRVLRNIDSLAQKLNEKKDEIKETSGLDLHTENINQLAIESDEIQSEIDGCKEEMENINAEIQSTSVSLEAKQGRLESVFQALQSLRNQESSLNEERTSSIKQLIAELENTQKNRDEITKENFNIQQVLDKLDIYGKLGQEFQESKDDLIRLIDEYLDLVRQRLKRNRSELKDLKKQLADEKKNINSMKKRLEEMENARLAQVCDEVEVEEEVEEEIEVEHALEVEIEEEMNIDIPKIENENKIWICEQPYIVYEENKSNNLETELIQSVRDFKSGHIGVDEINIILSNNKNAKILSKYKKIVDEIRIGNALKNKIDSIKRFLILENLKSINHKLGFNKSESLNGVYSKQFLSKCLQEIGTDIRLIEKIDTKLKKRNNSDFFIGNDNLDENVNYLINIIEGFKVFHLEKCAPNFNINHQISQYEKIIVKYNKEQSIENLSILKKEFTKHIQNEELNDIAFSKTDEFLRVLTENLIYHGIAIAELVIEISNTKNDDNDELINKLKKFESIRDFNLKKDEIKNFISENRYYSITNQIHNIINAFQSIVKNKKQHSLSKSAANKDIRQIEHVTKKLIQYSGDIEYEKQIGNMIERYVALKNENNVNEIITELKDELERLEEEVQFYDIHNLMNEMLNEIERDADSESPQILNQAIEKYKKCILDRYKLIEIVDEAEIENFIMREIKKLNVINTIKDFEQLDDIFDLEERFNMAKYSNFINGLRLIGIDKQEKIFNEFANALKIENLACFRNIINSADFNNDIFSRLDNEIVMGLIENHFEIEKNLLNYSAMEYRVLIEGLAKKTNNLEDWIKLQIDRYVDINNNNENEEFKKNLILFLNELLGEKLHEFNLQDLKDLDEFLKTQLKLSEFERVIDLISNIGDFETLVGLKDFEITALKDFKKQADPIKQKESFNRVFDIIQNSINLTSELKKLEYNALKIVLSLKSYQVEEIESLLKSSQSFDEKYLLSERYNILCYNIVQEIALKLKSRMSVSGKDNNVLSEIASLISTLLKYMEGSENNNNYERYTNVYKKILEFFDVENPNIELNNTMKRFFKEIFNKQLEQYLKQLKCETKSNLLDVLKSYCENESIRKIITKKDIEAFIVHQDNEIEFINDENKNVELSSYFYDYYKQLNSVAQTDSIEILQSFLIKQADMIKLNKIYKIFENQLKLENERKNVIANVKKSVIDEYCNNLNMPDKVRQRNLCKIQELNLDKLDKLISDETKEDIFYIKREEEFKILEEELKSVEVVGHGKAESIEDLIAQYTNKIVFSKNVVEFSVDILKHVETIINSPASIDSDYRISEKDGKCVMLEEIFDDFGRFKEKDDFYRDKTVVAFFGHEEYFKLCKDLQKLLLQSKKYKDEMITFKKGLMSLFEKLKLRNLKQAINNYNVDKNIKNLMDILKHFVYYITLKEEHLKVDQNWFDLMNKFVESLNMVMVNLVINKVDDQKIVVNLRMAIDYFSEDILRNNENAHDLLKSLKVLRSDILIYKAYKDVTYSLVEEDEKRFYQNYKINKLEELVNEIKNKLMAIIGLREFGYTGNEPDVLFKILQKDDYLLGHIADVKGELDKIEKSLLFDGLTGGKENIDSLSAFIEAINNNVITWNKILSNEIKCKKDEFKLLKIELILRQFSEDINIKYLNELVTVLESKSSLEYTKLAKCVLEVYVERKVNNFKSQSKDKTEKEINDILVKINLAIKRIYMAFYIMKTEKNTNSTGYTVFTNQVDSLIQKCFQSNVESIENNVNKTVIEFITTLIGEKSEYLNEMIMNKIFEDNDDLLIKLALLAQIPNGFYNDDTMSLYNELISRMKSVKNDEISIYLRDHIFNYFSLYIAKMMNIEIDSWKKNNAIDAIRRLYEHLDVVIFNEMGIEWIQNDKMFQLDETKNDKNCIFEAYKSYSNIKDYGYILKFLNNSELKHILWLLAKPEELLTTKDFLNDVFWKKNATENSEIIEKIDLILQTENAKCWKDELIALRFSELEKKLVLSVKTHDTSKVRIKDVIDAFKFLNEKNGSIEEALNTLEMVYANLNKLNSKVNEELYEVLHSFLYTFDFDEIQNLLSGSKHCITYDLLFARVNVNGSLKLRNSLEKLKIVLSTKSFLEVEYFCKIIVIKIKEQENGSSDALAEIIDLIIESKVYANKNFLTQLNSKPVLFWKIDLRKVIIKETLNETHYKRCREKEKDKAADLLYKIEDNKGVDFFNGLFVKIKALKSKNLRNLNLILSKIACKPVNKETLMNLGDDVELWENILFYKKRGKKDEDLSIEELFELMKEGNKISAHGINESVKKWIENGSIFADVLQKARVLDKKAVMVKNANSVEDWMKKNIIEWKAEDIEGWSKAFKSYEKYQNIESLKLNLESLDNNGLLIEILSVLVRAVQIYNTFAPRYTQLMALVLLLGGDQKGRLGNIYTGEGKTLITVMTATCLGLIGKKVDIVTSSKVLAVRDSKAKNPDTGEGYQDFFKMFDLNASNNCDTECEHGVSGESERKRRYESFDIIYGEAGYFQRDILLTQFFNKNIRLGNNGIADALILDEVDNMMIDNAVKTLYISHKMTDMRHLKDVFIQIWTAVNGKERIYTEENLRKICQYIKKITGNCHEIKIDHDELKVKFASIQVQDESIFCGKKDQIKDFCFGEKSVQLNDIWEIKLINKGVFSKDDILDSIKSIVSGSGYNWNELSGEQEANIKILMSKLGFDGEIEEDSQLHEYKISIPSTLFGFLDKNLRRWVENAYFAKYIAEEDSYIIGDAESQKQGEVVIMDKDTGVEQNSTKWSNGLHQFLQLKHSGKLSDESLKAVFISNMNYFQRYDNLYGMSGTVGGVEERNLIRETYGVDFFELPRFKEYCYEYDIEAESVACTRQDWLQNIVNNVDENMDQQLVYTENDIKMLNMEKEKLEKDQKKKESEMNDLETQRVNFETDLNNTQKEEEFLLKLVDISSGLFKLCDEKEEFEEKISKLKVLLDEFEKCDNLFNKDKLIQTVVDTFRKILSDLLKTKNIFDIENGIKKFKESKVQLDIANLKNTKQECAKKLGEKIKEISDSKRYITLVKENIDKDIHVYQKELQSAKVGEKSDSKRAVLIICENIKDSKKIEERIRKEFNKPEEYHVFLYDRAYRPFEKARLEAGDIVIATNIAGRGTDLGVTPQVEKNGGLHVILSYMPTNIRVELQAFGRTARKGNRGSGTYIVYDPLNSNGSRSVEDLKNERDARELMRLQEIQQKQFPKVKFEDELFVQFDKLRENLETKLKNNFNKRDILKLKLYEKKMKLQIDSLKNKWAIWLNMMDDKLKKVNESEKIKEQVKESYVEFEKMINSAFVTKYGLIDEPGELNKLGRLYLDNKLYSEAIECFSYIIDNHKAFSDIARYYLAFCIIAKDGGGYESKLKAKETLKTALSMFETNRSKILSRNQILKSINDMAKSDGGRGLEANYFAKQNEGEAQLLSIHINAINEAIGSEITADNFNTAGLAGDEPQRIFDELLKNEYGIFKNTRISKKCIIGSKILIKSADKRGEILLDQIRKFDESLTKLSQQTDPILKKYNKDLMNCINDQKSLCNELINAGYLHSQEFLTYKTYSTNNTNASYKNFKEIVRLLKNCKIISDVNIYKNENDSGLLTEKSSKLIQFPDMFASAKDDILEDMNNKLMNSNDSYKNREILVSSFEDKIYTCEKFLNDAKDIVKKEIVIQINYKDIKEKLAGKLDHECFMNKGDKIKETLLHNYHERIKLENELERKITCFVSDNSDESKKSEDEIIKNIQDNIKSLLGPIVKQDFIKKLENDVGMNTNQAENVLKHLEFYELINVDYEALRRKFDNVKNESIFFSKKSSIKEFCLGQRSVLVNNKEIRLLNSKPFSKDDIVEAIKSIIGMTNTTDLNIESSLKALLRHLGFDSGVKYDVMHTYEEYSFKNKDDMEKLEKYMSVISLKHVQDTSEFEGTLNNKIDWSCIESFQNYNSDIKCILKENIGKEVTKESFVIDEYKMEKYEFEILRGMLTDASLITTSLYKELMGAERYISDEMINIDLERILTVIYQNDGKVTDQNFMLKKAKEGSEELFNRMRELGIIKPVKMNFKLARGKYVPEFVGGNAWKDSSDPAKRMEFIEGKIEDIVKKVFKLERKDDTGHKINEYITGGLFTESENKELDEKVKTITDILKQAAGTMRVFPEIKLEQKDLQEMFNGGNPPPELVDYISICFESVLNYKEDKGFDWDCFLCAIIGVAQIVAGVAIEVFTAGAGHWIAQTLISEGIGDIVFAIQAGIEGNFSWKSYGQHKVQSLIISIMTAGVGKLLSKGAQTGKMALGLSTKTAIAKAIFKESMVHVITGVSNSLISVGAEEISKLIIENIADTHFMKHFEKWVTSDSTYLKKVDNIDNKLHALFNNFGLDCKQDINKCVQEALYDLTSGTLGDKIFSQISKVVGGLTKSFSMASQALGKGSGKAKILGSIATVLDKTAMIGKYVSNFNQLCNICNEFYDHLENKLMKLEKNLYEKKQSGQVKFDVDKIAKEKLEVSFQDEVKSVLQSAEHTMHDAFKQKIRQGFLQPAVNSLLHMAVTPIIDIIKSPFANALQELEDHKLERAESFKDQILAQNQDKLANLTTSQKKALEENGDIIDPKLLKEQLGEEAYKKMMEDKEAIANFPGESLKALMEQHGENGVKLMFKDGQIYVVLPTHTQMCNNIASGKVKQSTNTYSMRIAASKLGRNIEIFNPPNENGEITAMEDVPKNITPFGKQSTSDESIKLAFFPGKDGGVGHYAPLVKNAEGKWEVVDIPQGKDTKDSCFAQSMLFMKNYENSNDVEAAKEYAQSENNVKDYYKSLGNYAKSNKRVKENYLEGASVKRNRLVGGIKVVETEGQTSLEVEDKDLDELKTAVNNTKNKRGKPFDDYFQNEVPKGSSRPEVLNEDGEIDKSQYTYHHIIPNNEIVSILKSLLQNPDEVKESLQKYLNKEHIKSVIINNKLLERTQDGTHGKLIHAAVCNNPNNFVYGPGFNQTGRSHRGLDPKDKIDEELLEKQTANYITSMNKYYQNKSLGAFGSLPNTIPVNFEQYTGKTNKNKIAQKYYAV